MICFEAEVPDLFLTDLKDQSREMKMLEVNSPCSCFFLTHLFFPCVCGTLCWRLPACECVCRSP